MKMVSFAFINLITVLFLVYNPAELVLLGVLYVVTNYVFCRYRIAYLISLFFILLIVSISYTSMISTNVLSFNEYNRTLSSVLYFLILSLAFSIFIYKIIDKYNIVLLSVFIILLSLFFHYDVFYNDIFIGLFKVPIDYLVYWVILGSFLIHNINWIENLSFIWLGCFGVLLANLQHFHIGHILDFNTSIMSIFAYYLVHFFLIPILCEAIQLSDNLRKEHYV